MQDPISFRKLLPLEKIPQKTRMLYQKYQHKPERDIFRNNLVNALGLDLFAQLARYLTDDGLVIFRQFALPMVFTELVLQYDRRMVEKAQASVGHTFVDFQKDKFFLTSHYSSEALLHPLLLALISYQLGGPIRLVDIRGKDTGPALTTIRDNGVHVDDSLYGTEYKILVLWEKGTTRGPRSQNFVAIPRSNQLVRVVSTEHGANFNGPKEITHEILEHPDLAPYSPFVIEAKDEKPLTVVFDATGIAHHRFRTIDNPYTRSCLILAFHVDDEFNSPAHYVVIDGVHCELNRFVIGGGGANETPNMNTSYFLNLLEKNKLRIAEKLAELERCQMLVPLEEKKLSRNEVMNWLATIGRASVFETSSPQMSGNDIRDPKTVEEILIISEYDKHFDLDLLLYPDRREVLRKSLRQRIRELTLDEMRMRIHFMRRLYNLGPIIVENIVPNYEVKKIADQLCMFTDFLRRGCGCREQLKALLGIHQLATDLGEAMLRCNSAQLYRTSVLFLYWTIDELYEWVHQHMPESPYIGDIENMAQDTLAHYSALLWHRSLEHV